MIFAYFMAGATIVTVALAIYHRDSEYLFIGLMFGLLLFLFLFLFVLVGGCITELIGAPQINTVSEPMALYTIGDDYVINSSDYYSYCYEDPNDGIKINKENKAICHIYYSDIESPYCTEEVHEFKSPILNFIFPLKSHYFNFYIPEGTIGIVGSE